MTKIPRIRGKQKKNLNFYKLNYKTSDQKYFLIEMFKYTFEHVCR